MTDTSQPTLIGCFDRCTACVAAWMVFGMSAPKFQRLLDGEFVRLAFEFTWAFLGAWIAYRAVGWLEHPSSEKPHA